LIFAMAVMLALTSVVVVPEGQRAVVLHMGRIDQRGTLYPGVHLKWPWPIDRAERFSVDKVHEILLGAGERRDPNERKGDFINGREMFLWTAVHGAYKEQDFLVAVSPRERASVPGTEAATSPSETRPASTRPAAPPRGVQQPPPPVTIIKLVASVQYVIDDPYKFAYKHADAGKLLECVAYREMTRYCASATLDDPEETRSAVATGGADAIRPTALLTRGQRPAADALRRRIEQAVGPGGLDVGVRIVHVGFLAVHPPADAAPAYEAVMEARCRVDEKRFEAQAEADKTLTEVAGDPQTALELALAIQVVSHLEGLRNLAGGPRAMEAKLDEYARAETERIKALDAEIQRERLLGRLRGGEDTTATAVRDKHRAHLARLTTWKQSPPKDAEFDALLAQARQDADRLLARSTGKPAITIAQAVAKRWATELRGRADAETFDRKLVAYQASPRVYVLERWLEVWDDVLPRVLKYVVGVDPERIEVRLNLEQEQGVTERPTYTEEITPKK
jgi:regulator of protease activity HflC (stomatin/prohibitin superfamily)